MANLIERSPCEGLLPVTAGTVTLTEARPGPITSVSPLKGRERAVSAALKPLGLSFPGPGVALSSGVVSCVWTGRGQAFLLGAPAPADLAGIAALADQSDGWAVMRLEGEGVEAVLARLVPVDLRAAVFLKGRCVRSTLGHLPLILTRLGDDSFDLMVFRSMAATAVHEVQDAMRAVAARG